jgi:hypothetical protein
MARLGYAELRSQVSLVSVATSYIHYIETIVGFSRGRLDYCPFSCLKAGRHNFSLTHLPVTFLYLALVASNPKPEWAKIVETAKTLDASETKVNDFLKHVKDLSHPESMLRRMTYILSIPYKLKQLQRYFICKYAYICQCFIRQYICQCICYSYSNF